MRAPTGLRNAALIVLLYRTGLRLQEALDLVPSDIDFAERSVTVRRGVELDQGRTAYFTEDVLPLLSRWLERRGGRDDGPLFCTLAGAPMARSYVQAMLARKRTKAGITKRVHAEGLRYTFKATKETTPK